EERVDRDRILTELLGCVPVHKIVILFLDARLEFSKIFLCHNFAYGNGIRYDERRVQVRGYRLFGKIAEQLGKGEAEGRGVAFREHPKPLRDALFTVDGAAVLDPGTFRVPALISIYPDRIFRIAHPEIEYHVLGGTRDFP